MTTPAEPKYSDAERDLVVWMRETNGHCADAFEKYLASRPPTPDKAATPVDAVTRSSALDAIGHVERHNGPGRANQARRMLMSATPDKAGVSDAQVYRACKVGRITRDEPSAGELNRMRQVLEHFASQSAEAVRDGERWRFFCDNVGVEYGDGYTEPRENYAALEWQQGPWIYDGSNGGRGRPDRFPGWSAIIDELMEEARLSGDEEASDAATQEQSQPVAELFAGTTDQLNSLSVRSHD